MSLHLQMKKIPFCIQSYLSTGQYRGLSLLSCSVSSHYPTPCFRAKGGTLFMLTQGALRDKDEWEWDPACENWVFFFIEEELMLISDCIFASLIVIEFFFFKWIQIPERREREKGEEGGAANYAWRLLMAWLSASSCMEEQGEGGRWERQTHWRRARNSPIHWKRDPIVSGAFPTSTWSLPRHTSACVCVFTDLRTRNSGIYRPLAMSTTGKCYTTIFNKTEMASCSLKWLRKSFLSD